MIFEKKIAVVIPTYKSISTIFDVVGGIPEWVDHIFLVDDKCPDKTGSVVEDKLQEDKRVKVIFHESNQGVGGATITGYKAAMAKKCDIVVKMDSDDQMDPKYLEKLIKPLIELKATYTKGNRFSDFKALRAMPRVRLLGNSALSFMVKVASGYWNLMDPTNGYTAISIKALQKLDFNKISNRYFFETDMLVNLNIQNSVVKDVSIPARYGEENSSLSISDTLFKFPPKLLKSIVKRFFFKYLIYNFNMASVYTLIGFPLVLWGFFFGIFVWISNSYHNIETPTGTIMLSVLPLILGFQFILSAINIDINSTPGIKNLDD